jgi:hypothetical protein
MSDKEKKAVRLVEDIEYGLCTLATANPTLTLNEIHNKVLDLHELLRGQ